MSRVILGVRLVLGLLVVLAVVEIRIVRRRRRRVLLGKICECRRDRLYGTMVEYAYVMEDGFVSLYGVYKVEIPVMERRDNEHGYRNGKSWERASMYKVIGLCFSIIEYIRA
jgi:hypothetical protein